MFNFSSKNQYQAEHSGHKDHNLIKQLTMDQLKDNIVTFFLANISLVFLIPIFYLLYTTHNQHSNNIVSILDIHIVRIFKRTGTKRIELK